MKQSTYILSVVGIAFAGILTMILTASCCCKVPNSIPSTTDSVAYDMYRGINITNHEITPIYIPQKDSVFLATDTIRINGYGVYTLGSSRRATLGVFVSVVKFAKED